METTSSGSKATEQSPSPPKQHAPPREKLSWGQSFKTWLYPQPSLDELEYKILSRLPFFPDSDEHREAKLQKVPIGDGTRYINELEIRNKDVAPPTEKSTNGKVKDVVLIHGFGAGLAFYQKNLEALTEEPGRVLHVIELLGFGNSSRPQFSIPTKNLTEKDSDGNFKAVLESEDWYTSAIEEWRVAKELDQFHLIGHSFGGYIALSYAGKYASRVKSLVLVSPAGVSRGYNDQLEVTTPWRKNKKVTLDVDPEDVAIEEFELGSDEQRQAIQKNMNKPQTQTHEMSFMSNLLAYMWNKQVSPFTLLKMTAFAGPRLVSGYAYRRFRNFSYDEQTDMQAYAYRLFTMKQSGEYGLGRILAPGAFARMPMVDRVHKLVSCPTLWMYGSDDWMDANAGLEASRILREKKKLPAEFEIVKHAGHNIFLDNRRDFHLLVNRFLKKHA